MNDEPRATNIAINDGAWHFVAVTWSNSQGDWQIFIDGVLSDGGSTLRPNDLIIGMLRLQFLNISYFNYSCRYIIPVYAENVLVINVLPMNCDNLIFCILQAMADLLLDRNKMI